MAFVVKSEPLRQTSTGVFRCLVHFVDDINQKLTVDQDFDLSSPSAFDSFAAMVESQRSDLDLLYAKASVFSPGDVPKPTPDPVDPVAEAKSLYFRRLNSLRSMSDLVGLGVIKADDADLAALLAEVTGLYKPEYYS